MGTISPPPSKVKHVVPTYNSSEPGAWNHAKCGASAAEGSAVELAAGPTEGSPSWVTA